jgi:hypothetical protein
LCTNVLEALVIYILEGLKQIKNYEESNFIRNEFEAEDLKKALIIVIASVLTGAFSLDKFNFIILLKLLKN